jgi:hypothetical protein
VLTNESRAPWVIERQPATAIVATPVRAVALARQWADRLAAGEVGSLKELALTEG